MNLCRSVETLLFRWPNGEVSFFLMTLSLVLTNAVEDRFESSPFVLLSFMQRT